MHKNLSTFDPKRPPYPLLFKITNFTVIEYYRNKKKDSNVKTESEYQFDEHTDFKDLFDSMIFNSDSFERDDFVFLVESLHDKLKCVYSLLRIIFRYADSK